MPSIRSITGTSFVTALLVMSAVEAWALRPCTAISKAEHIFSPTSTL